MDAFESKIKTQVPIYPYTTFRIGGRAKYFVLAESLDDIKDAISWSHEKKIKTYIMAGGSNILANDGNIEGLVIKIGNREIRTEGDNLVCGAGAPLSGAVSAAWDSSLSGLEWASGIPGSVGGAVRGNAGAYGGSMSDSVISVYSLGADAVGLEEFDNASCAFRYRDSRFTQDNRIIWEIRFELKKKDQAQIKAGMDEIIGKRNQRIPREPSAGSVFKNMLWQNLSDANPKLAARAVEEGRVKGGKVPSAWFIDLLDLKGKRIGGAEVSRLHANFIVNMGDATTSDVTMLVSFLKQQVRNKFGIELMEEIQYFGF